MIMVDAPLSRQNVLITILDNWQQSHRIEYTNKEACVFYIEFNKFPSY